MRATVSKRARLAGAQVFGTLAQDISSSGKTATITHARDINCMCDMLGLAVIVLQFMLLASRWDATNSAPDIHVLLFATLCVRNVLPQQIQNGLLNNCNVRLTHILSSTCSIRLFSPSASPTPTNKLYGGWVGCKTILQNNQQTPDNSHDT